MVEYWVVFIDKNTGKHLCRYTVEGTFSGEARATRELLANEKNIPIEDIDVKLLYKGRKGCWKEWKGV